MKKNITFEGYELGGLQGQNPPFSSLFLEKARQNFFSVLPRSPAVYPDSWVRGTNW